MNTQNKNIVNLALENLANSGIEGMFEDIGVPDLDGELELLIDQYQYQFGVEVKREIRNHQLPQILKMAERNPNKFMVVATKIYPKVKVELRNHRVPYLEANGNLWLKMDNVFVWIDSNKDIKLEKEKLNRAFTKTGLKVIFHFLLDDNNINQTYREIAQKTQVGLGNINYVINGLKEEGYLVNLSKTSYQLINKKELLQKWMQAYHERLKPTLLIGRYRFIKEEDFLNWKNLVFVDDRTVWGGEPAGEILTNYLKPGQLTIYTDENRNELIKHYRLIPDPGGNIHVYTKFWDTEDKLSVAPAVLTYADLMNTGDTRNIETAQRVLKDVLQNQF